MLVRLSRLLGLVLLVAASAGCGGLLHDVIPAHAKGEGSARIYSAPRAGAWAASHAELTAQKVDYIEDHDAEGYMLAEIKPGLFTYGTFIGVWLEPQGPDHTRVTVVTKRRDVTYFKGLNESTFLDDLEKRLASAQPPSAAPPPPPVLVPSSAPAAASAP